MSAGPWKAVDTVTGRTVYAATAERAVYAAVRAGIPTVHMRITDTGDPMQPPPKPKQQPRVLQLWDDVEQAKRAWAVTQACRAAAGTDRLLTHIFADADAILAWTESAPTGAEGHV
jgi:nicotinamidase-related amidase